MKKIDDYTQEECKTAVIFARVSSERQETGASIDAQHETIEKYCEEKGFNIIKEFIITESSTRGDRKQYHEMLNFVSKQKVKIAIVVNCVDRLQRSYKDTPILDELRKQGKIEVHFLKENLILHKDSNGMDILFWNMSVLMANSYVLSLADNVKRSLNHNWSLGKWQGFAPVGYMNIKKEGDRPANIVLDPDRAPQVKRLFEEYATGLHTLQSLENMAKSMKLNTRQKNSKYLSRTHIQNILQNPFYYGVMVVKGKHIPHIYEPLISKALFDMVQDVMKDKSKPEFKLGRGEIPFVFRGLIRCGECGGTITCESHKSKSGNVHTYLKCNHKKGPCSQGIVKEDVLLQQLNEEVFNHISMPNSMMTAIKAAVREKLAQEDQVSRNVEKVAKTRLAELEKKNNKLFDFYLDGKCNQATYEHQKALIDAERIELQEAIEKNSAKNTEDVKIFDSLLEITASAKRIMNSSIISKKRALLNLVLSNATLNGTSLCFSLKKPFDKLFFAKGCKTWLGQLDSNQRHTD